MSKATCTECPSMGRLLEGRSSEVWVEYYACDVCRHVWMVAKNSPDAPAVAVVVPKPTFRVVQPWRPDKARQVTALSAHDTIDEAFNALDAVANETMRTSEPSDAIELIVVDEHGRVVPRPGTH